MNFYIHCEDLGSSLKHLFNLIIKIFQTVEKQRLWCNSSHFSHH